MQTKEERSFYMEHVLYWLWLTLKPEINSTRITFLMEHFETIEDIYKAEDYSRIPRLTPSVRRCLADKSLDKAKKVFMHTRELDAKILVYDDSDYPDMLRNIIDPPYVLYLKGKVLNWDRLFMIGVIGKRKCRADSRIIAANISRDLARSGVTVVGGMAEGIDSVGAEAALRAGGRHIAVIGSGIDVIYPRENEGLYERIINNGAVITEYPPGTRPYKTNFPERNRIIAGLSRGVLVVEAAIRSGSLITARIAIENNRDVFAVPGQLNDAAYAGSNAIIQQYAKLVTCARDILEEYPYETARLTALPPKRAANNNFSVNTVPESGTVSVTIDDKKYERLNDRQKSIIKLLIEKNRQGDELTRITGIPAGELNTIMVILEMNGLVKRLPGNNYKLKI